MHVFVTGAAGFIGQATIKELQSHGHTVTGLARNDANASIITSLGATPLRGDLADLDSLRRGAASSDGVVHLGFVHDFANFASVCATDRAAIQAMGEAIAGTNKPLIISSGTLGCPKGAITTEDTENERNNPPFTDRALSADLTHKFAKESGVRGMVVRFAPTVHAEGKGGLTRAMIDIYRQKGGPVVYVGDGAARWPACHRDDAATLIRLVLEKGQAGKTYHAVDEEGVSMKDVAEMIGKGLKQPVESTSAEEAAKVVGMFGPLMAADNPTSSEKTRKELGWEARGLGLLKDFTANFPQ